MRDLQMLDDKQLAQASQERLVVQRGTVINALGPYFADWVRGQVEQVQPADESSSGGLRIYTTLNTVLQRAAEGALARGLDRLEGQYRALTAERPPPRGSRERSWRWTPAPARSARWSEAATTGRASSTASCRRDGSPARRFKPFVYLRRAGPGASRRAA